MRDLVSVAKRLRAVRDASRGFLTMWVVDRVVNTPLMDRVANAVDRHERGADVPASLDERPPADDEMTGGKRSRFDDDPPRPSAS